MSDSKFAAFKKPFNFDDNPTHELLCCWNCQKFIAVENEEAKIAKCPVCESFGEFVSSVEAWPKQCTRDGCDKQGEWVEEDACSGTWGRKKKQECKYKTVAYDENTAWGAAVVEAEEETTIPGLSHLQNIIDAANEWNTSHHKDKKGSHTSSEKATHAKGDKQDKSQKDTRIRFIREAMEKVTDNYESSDQYPGQVKEVLENANKAIKRLEKL